MAAQEDTEIRRRNFGALDTTQDPFASTSTNPTHYRVPDPNDSDELYTTFRNLGDKYQIQKWVDDMWKEYERDFEKELRSMGFEHTMEEWFSECDWWLDEVAEWVRGLDYFDEDTPEEEIRAYFREIPELPAQTLPVKSKASKKLEASTAPAPREWPVWKEPEVDEWLWFKNTLATLFALSCVVLVVGTLWYLVTYHSPHDGVHERARRAE